MIARFDAALEGWHAERVGFRSLVSTLELLVEEIPHDRFQRECNRSVSELEIVNAMTLADGPVRGFTHAEKVFVDEQLQRIARALDRARREIDDPCRVGQSCRS